ncbi:hypothetical protein EJB05_40257 [Eragrostis curvula]|uniref:Uncharacterized protein n=1 Tax=Eragrostis curvula TaxID=38414 RepID=A0A5J9TZ42_9POAL|nr:hypothetical protein EJB05_40257 [Eragrostis curvula]
MVAWAALPPMSNGVAASRRRRRGAGVDLQPSSSLNRQEARGTTEEEEEEEEEAASAVAEEGWRIQDIVAIAVHLGELEHIGTSPNRRQYRDILMDASSCGDANDLHIKLVRKVI